MSVPINSNTTKLKRLTSSVMENTFILKERLWKLGEIVGKIKESIKK